MGLVKLILISVVLTVVGIIILNVIIPAPK